MTVNKSELAKRVAEQTGLTKADATRALESMVEVVQAELAKGGKVSLHGFGTFSVRERAARTGRNPQTGEEIKIAAATVPKFSAAKGLKDAVQ